MNLELEILDTLETPIEPLEGAAILAVAFYAGFVVGVAIT